MTENLLISIIMPSYNAEKTIYESIKSVQKQSYKNWELIIIDDHSIDHTFTIIQKISNQDSRIISIKNERNCGVSATRNKGVSLAKGQWIAFLDSDDQWTYDKLEKQVHIIQSKTNADLIFTGSSYVNYSGQISKYQLIVPQTIFYQELLKQNVISCSSVLVRKDLVQAYPMVHDEMHEDYAVWLQILRDGYHAYGINEPLLIYRLSESSKSSNKKKAAIMTYKVYRFMGLSHMKAIYYFIWYVYRNIKKYININKKL